MTSTNELSNQALLLLMIFFILATLGLSFAIFTINKSWQEVYDEASANLTQARTQATQTVERVEERNLCLSLITGANDPVDSEYTLSQPPMRYPTRVAQGYFRAAGQALDDLRLTIGSIPGSESVVEALRQSQVRQDGPKISCPHIDAIQSVNEGNSAAPWYTGTAVNYRVVVWDLIEELKAVRPLIITLRQQRDAERIRGIVAQDTTRDSLAGIQRDRAGLQRDLGAAQQRIGGLRASHDQLERTHLQEVADQQGQIQTVVQGARDEREQLQGQIASLEERIHELEVRRQQTLVETTADGTVVYADTELGLAWIDLTATDGLRLGLTFEVFQFVKGGEKEIRGVIQVRELGETVSQVAIVDTYYMRNLETGEMRALPGIDAPIPVGWQRVLLPDPENPITQGDLIRSPYFDPSEQPTFVFVGTRVLNERYGISDLTQRIEEIGGRVDDRVTIETDFAIILEDAREAAPEEFQKAVQFGVVMMREPDLIEYLDRRR